MRPRSSEGGPILVRRLLMVLAVVALLMAAVSPVGAQESVSVPDDALDDIYAAKQTATYIVIMAEEPLVATFGQDDLDSSKARAKDKKLRGNQNKALRDAGASTSAKGYSYTVSVNGFSAKLTAS